MFTRTSDLYINLAAGTAGPLLDSAISLVSGSKPVWNQNDKFTLRLFFLTPGATSFVPPTLTALDAGAVIVLGGRPAANLDTAGLLFSATDFTKSADDDPLGIYYYSDLNLNTEALATALTSVKNISVLVDLEIQNAANTQRLTVPQFAVTILHDVVHGDEGVPVSGDPVYPVPSAIELVANKGVANGYAALDGTGKIPLTQLPDLTDTDTETDPIVGAVTGIVKANGAGTISAAVVGTDYQAPLTAGTDYLAPTGDGSGLTGLVLTETDPVVGAINGLVKANGAGTISAATPGTDYLTPTGDGSGLTGLTLAETDPIFAAWLAARLPAVPTGLGAAVISTSRIDLAWDGTDGITYKVYQDGVLIDSPSANNLSVTGLTASTLYSFTVSAVNSWGESAQCSPATATTNDIITITNPALQFDDTDSHVEVAGGSQWSPANLTVECWFKKSIPLGYENCYLLGGNTRWLIYVGGAGDLVFSTTFGDLNVGVLGVIDGAWHHVAFTFDGSTITGFVDGELISSASVSGTLPDISSPMFIGWFTEGTAPQNPFNGSMDEVRISSVIRYTERFTPTTTFTPDSDTVGYWKFNEGTGTTAADSSGNGYHGTLAGSTLPLWVDGLEPITTTDFSILCAGGGGVTVPNNSLLFPSGSFTIEAWEKFAGGGVNHSLVGCWDGSAGYGIALAWDGILFVSNIGGSSLWVGDYPGFYDGNWHHIAGVYDQDAGTVSLFVDGVQIGTMAASGSLTPNTGNLNIGFDQWGEQFVGCIDEVRLSNVARYSSTFSPPTSLGSDGNTVGYWRFNEGRGATAHDSSGNGLHGTLSGVTWSDGCSV